MKLIQALVEIERDRDQRPIPKGMIVSLKAEEANELIDRKVARNAPKDAEEGRILPLDVE